MGISKIAVECIIKHIFMKIITYALKENNNQLALQWWPALPTLAAPHQQVRSAVWCGCLNCAVSPPMP